MVKVYEVSKSELLDRLSYVAGELSGCSGDYCLCHSERWEELDEILFLLGYEEMDR